MQGIQNIIFDLGGVILNLDNQFTEMEFVALGAPKFSENFGHGHAASFFREYELGKIGNQEFVAELKKMVRPGVPDNALVHAWNKLLLDFPPERIALLKSLRYKYRLFLFSNTNALHLDALNQIYRRHSGSESLDDLFEKAYYSHLLGMRKPDAASFEYILRENQLDPRATLFVDDAWINVEGAIDAGLRGLYLPPGMAITDIRW